MDVKYPIVERTVRGSQHYHRLPVGRAGRESTWRTADSCWRWAGGDLINTRYQPRAHSWTQSSNQVPSPTREYRPCTYSRQSAAAVINHHTQ